MIVNYENIPRSREQMIKLLRESGSLSVDFQLKNKRKMKRGFNNIVAFEKARRRRSSLPGKFKYLILAIGNMYFQVFAGTRDRGLSLALLIFQASWQYIESYDGKDIDGETARVTFYART